jgi:hypothetical protein
MYVDLLHGWCVSSNFMHGCLQAAKMGISSELDIIFREVGLHKDLMTIQSSQKFYMAESRHRNPSSVPITFSKVKYPPEVEAQANLLYQQVIITLLAF